MSNTFSNRSELLFLYDVKNNNPNGDPGDMNRPRMDEDTRKCLVTDVRLKRTIRDYLQNYENEEIFIREVHTDEGNVKDVKMRVNDFLSDDEVKDIKTAKELEKIGKEKVLSSCVDIRLFGAVLPVSVKVKNDKGKESEKKGSITLTGPVQFSIGKSLHPVRENGISLSLTMATKKDSQTGSLAESGKQTIRYGLIGFHGVANEHAAKHCNTSDDDLKKLLRGMWLGTKNLLTASKKGHMPRLLLKIDYKDSFFIGDLMEYIEMEPKNGKEIEYAEDPKDYILDVSQLNKKLIDCEDRIEAIYYEIDDRFELSAPIHKAKAFGDDVFKVTKNG